MSSDLEVSGDQCGLAETHKELTKKYNELRQESHVLSLKLEVVEKTNCDLTNELETTTYDYEKLLKEKKQIEAKLSGACSEIVKLQEDKYEMQKCIQSLAEQLKQCTAAPRIETPVVVCPSNDSNSEHFELIEKMNEELLETEAKLANVVQENSLLSKDLASQKERCEALQSNYESTRHNLEEMQDLLEAAQSHSASLAAELEELRSNPEAKKKGNSLFAEVADQRKKLISIINDLKVRYYSLKAEHQNCPTRFRELRNMQIELTTKLNQCIGAVADAEKEHERAVDALNGRLMLQIKKVTDRNNYLEHHLAKNSQSWVETLVNYNMETINDLRAQLMDCLTKHRIAEDDHLWKAKELTSVRLQLAKLMLNSCEKRIEDLDNGCCQTLEKLCESEEAPATTPLVGSKHNTSDLCTPSSSVEAPVELPPLPDDFAQPTKTEVNMQEAIEDVPIAANKEPEPGDKEDDPIRINSRKPLVIRRIKLFPRPTDN
ncbi:protein Spindly [Anopheles ziemanni]|uniref:protein Spindly n=1 Tax=Anopheles coustani TaxID=139045 RepID=UPI0026599B9D|nr:protein Spindly [Anopheles coustani]XP_058170095.1 protein Spindly [Anopheles ziemanni]